VNVTLSFGPDGLSRVQSLSPTRATSIPSSANSRDGKPGGNLSTAASSVNKSNSNRLLSSTPLKSAEEIFQFVSDSGAALRPYNSSTALGVSSPALSSASSSSSATTKPTTLSAPNLRSEGVVSATDTSIAKSTTASSTTTQNSKLSSQSSRAIEEGWGGNELDDELLGDSDEELDTKRKSENGTTSAISGGIGKIENANIVDSSEKNISSEYASIATDEPDDILSVRNLFHILSEGKLVLFTRTALFTKLADLLLFLNHVDIGARIQRPAEDCKRMNEFRQLLFNQSEYSTANSHGNLHRVLANLLCWNVCQLAMKEKYLHAGIVVMLYYQVHAHFFALNSAFYLLPRYFEQEMKRLNSEVAGREDDYALQWSDEFPPTVPFSTSDLRMLCGNVYESLKSFRSMKRADVSSPPVSSASRDAAIKRQPVDARKEERKSFIDDWL
jgi:hypothetical protein